MNRLKNKRTKDIIIIVLCLFASFQIVNTVLDPFIDVKAKNTTLKAQVDDETKKNEDLQNSLDQSENSSSMEEGYMRERFHMSKKDELIFVFPNND